jgi:hypothetical protein
MFCLCIFVLSLLSQLRAMAAEVVDAMLTKQKSKSKSKVFIATAVNKNNVYDII